MVVNGTVLLVSMGTVRCQMGTVLLDNLEKVVRKNRPQ